MDPKVLSLVILFVFVVGAFAVAAENKTTNQSIGNESNITNNTIKIQPLSARVSVNVTPTVVYFGTVPPDGIERSYPNAATVIIDHQGASDFYVRANGNLVSDSGLEIPISYLKFSTPNSPIRPFTTENQWISKYPGSGVERIPINFYITIPTYTDPGTYSATIIYTAT
ncbi:MAG: hypothetical protein QFX38_03255 [Methanothermobacter sp.]|nr:hypothetical protein [Methanothermobacter sp.]